MRIVRGETSLLPGTAKGRGDEPNESPLARLHAGFRRNDPGTNYLTAGDGNARLDTSEWVAAFKKGDPDYQEDTRWWEAAEQHDALKDEIKLEKERRKRQQEGADRGERNDPTSEFFDDLPASGGAVSHGSALPVVTAPAPRRPLTELERVERWEAAGRPLPALKGEYTAKGVGARPVKLDAWAVRGEPVTVSGERVPCTSSRARKTRTPRSSTSTIRSSTTSTTTPKISSSSRSRR